VYPVPFLVASQVGVGVLIVVCFVLLWRYLIILIAYDVMVCQVLFSEAL
jgi:hypothetical protein